jgi:hypothetical protein
MLVSPGSEFTRKQQTLSRYAPVCVMMLPCSIIYVFGSTYTCIYCFENYVVSYNIPLTLKNI